MGNKEVATVLVKSIRETLQSGKMLVVCRFEISGIAPYISSIKKVKEETEIIDPHSMPLLETRK